MAGFITIERDLWDHPLFKRSEMTEREAWMWMLAQSAWDDTRHRVGSEMVEVQRGSFVTTLREMQSVFMWRSDKRVRTFLTMLEREGMIGRTTVGTANAPKTHVTICNYDKYQIDGRAKDAPGTHQGRAKDAVKKEYNNTTREDANASMSDCPKSQSPSFDEFWTVWPLSKVNKQGARQAFTRLSQRDKADAISSAADWCRRWKGTNPHLNDIHPATYLNKRRWEDERAPSQPNLTLIPGGPREQSPQHPRQSPHVHPTDRAIAFASRAIRTPSQDCF